MSNLPNDRQYTKSHEWILIEGNTVAIGITDHAQEQLGDLVFVDLPDVGTDVSKGSDLVTLESVKAAADVYCPCEGKITSVNESLEDDPEQINTQPYDAWIAKIEVADANELEGLMDAQAYQQFIESE